MSNSDDLFPGFTSHWIATPAGKTFVRAGGKGEPLVLIHGFPQTHVMWHRVAPALAERFQVICMDLRGYGWSSAPHPEAGHVTYSKRAMGEDVLAVIAHFGHIRANVAGHDRGGRVAYRLALDHPGRIERLAVLDIVPTREMWGLIEAPGSTLAPHWRSMAQPAPVPEDEIRKKPTSLIDDKMAGWTATGDLKGFDPRALAAYRTFVQDPTRITAMCEDYRAGATLDRAADDADLAAGRHIGIPALALWGDRGLPAASADPLALWRPYAPTIAGRAIQGGHFLPEENPAATLRALREFFGA